MRWMRRRYSIPLTHDGPLAAFRNALFSAVVLRTYLLVGLEAYARGMRAAPFDTYERIAL
jgi:hypothetical protein